MDEALDIAERMANKPDLLPWVIFGCVVVVVLANQKRFLDLFDSAIRGHKARIKYYEEKEKSDTRMEEIVRANTEALNNNTKAFETITSDRGESRKMIDNHNKSMIEKIEHHEAMSSERDRHIQEVVNNVRDTVTDNTVKLSKIETELRSIGADKDDRQNL